MILATPLPLSSREAGRIKDWLARDEANLLIQIVNADIIRLQVLASNSTIQAMTYPNQVDAVVQAMEQIKELKIFLDILTKYTKLEQYALIKLEPQNE